MNCLCKHKKLWESLIFFGFVLLGMLVSAITQNNNLWDFANYHYYNAFAFLHNRLNFDIVPASVNGFFNPLIELPLYFYIQKFNNYPLLVFALQGIWFGLLLYVLYLICKLFFKDDKNTYFLTLIAMITACFGYSVLTQIGSCSNEIAVSFFILWGLYLLLKMIKYPELQKQYTILFAGLVMGISLGLKSTTVSYCLASGLTLFICYKYFKQKYLSIFCFACGGLLGFLLINGYFMYRYWELYQNPFFPFLNAVFKSEYFDDYNFKDVRYLPPLAYSLIYPLVWLSRGQFEIYADDFYSVRLTLYYVLLWLILLQAVKNKKIKFFYEEHKTETFLFLFVLLSYYSCMWIFSISRYMAVVECLCGILVVLFFKKYLQTKNLSISKKSVIIAILVWLNIILSIGYFIAPNITYEEDKFHPQKFLYVEKINVPENALIKTYNLQLSYVLPFMLTDKVRALGYLQMNNDFMKGADFAERGKFSKIREQIDKNHKGPKIIIYKDENTGTDKVVNLQKQIQQEKIIAKMAETTTDTTLQQKIKKRARNLKMWKIIRKELLNVMKDDYFCRELDNNIRSKVVICVPKELKEQIFLK